MIMLEKLNQRLGDIRTLDEWAADFIDDITLQKELEPEKPLTTEQFKKLCELYEQYGRLKR